MDDTSAITTELQERDFRHRIWIVTWVTLVLPPLTGIFMLSFVGVFPFPEVFYPFIDYAAIVVLFATAVGFKVTKVFIRNIIHLATSPESSAKYKKQLKRLPLYYFSVLFLYFAVGLISTLYSLSTLHGFNYPFNKYIISFLGVIPGGLITALPIFFYLTDTLGRFLAPRGIQITVAPIKLKLIVLGLFIPIFIDTLLIMYFYDRTGYLAVETIGIWFFLIVIAATGTFMAWGSFRQSLSPFITALKSESTDHTRVSIIPQSLDELGLLSQQWHQLWMRVLEYEKRMADTNVSLKSDVKQRTQELESERHFINKILEKAAALIVVLNRQGHIIRFNPACEKITGFSFDELNNRPIWEWLIPPEQVDEVKQVFQSLTDQRLDSTYENDLMKQDGGRVLVAWNNSTIRDENGKVLYIVSVGIDISARQAAQNALQQAKEFAEQASQAKSEFLSRMSHELRTPMNAILGFSQLLQMDNANLLDDQKGHVEEVIQGANHLLELINEVLDLARIEEGKFEVNIEPVSVSKIISDSSSLLMPLAQQANITLINNIPDDVEHLVEADRLRLKQVFINLLSNAIKYNKPDGKIYIDVNITVQDKLRISVRDTGTGIPLDQLDKLFLPFERIDSDKHQFTEGTGIGLALSQRLTKLMHGELSVDSLPGQGCTFFLELPYAGIEEACTTKTNDTSVVGADKSTAQPYRYTVLYVEDNPPNLRLVSSAMQVRTDIQLITAHTGTLGLDMAFAHRPDLILLDINLPGINGIDILHKLKRSDETQHIPVIAITANATPRDIQTGQEAGFDEYLIKPLNIKFFYQVLEQHLPQSK